MAPLDEVSAWLLERATRRPASRLPLADAGQRVLAEAVLLPPLPACPIAAIDGLAILAAESEGASEYAPVPIAARPVKAGNPLPCDADAVLPQWAFDDGPTILGPVAAGRFVVPAGHDAPGGTTLAAGTLLRPAHLALLRQAEIDAVRVVNRPRVLLEASKSGDLSLMLTALIQAEGGVVTETKADLVLRLGEDRAAWSDDLPVADIFAETGAPALTMPADPFRCLVLFAVLVGPVLRRMGGYAEPMVAHATLARKVTSGLGQVDAVPVWHSAGRVMPLGPADGCGLLAAASANGLLVVPANSEGYAEGAVVEVIPLA